MPTRQEMLSAIDMKIARTSQGEEGTGCFLPVMKEDVMRYVERNKIEEKILRGMQRGKTYTPISEELRLLWHYPNESLFHQSDDCVAYVFNLL